MALYLLQAAYTPEAWANQVNNPRNRIEDMKAILEGSNVTLRDAWYAFGEYDVMVLLEAPNDIDVASVAIVIASGGALKASKTTPLMSIEDGIEAIRRAGRIEYQPPPGK